jgi:hypothetical protein
MKYSRNEVVTSNIFEYIAIKFIGWSQNQLSMTKASNFENLIDLLLLYIL